MTEETRPLIAVPMGDPAGIGPEIVVKALCGEETARAARVVVTGDAGILRAAAGYCGLSPEIREIQAPGEGRFAPGVINVIPCGALRAGMFEMGRVSGDCGRAAYAYIERAVSLALAGEADAVATTTINKESLRAGGVPFIGHTEIFAHLCGVADPLTLFEVRGLRVFFLSRHVSLRESCDLVTEERLVDYGRRCTEALRRLGVTGGTLAIAGLNPHSGEHGLFGNEEVRAVEPAVRRLRAEGYDVAGPISADSVFHQALCGRYCAVLSLYHDQGHIATKTLDFERTISVTAGMPILRTSVDHGTAFDIAGTGRASAVSLIEAIRIAAKYAPFYRRTA